MTTTTQYDALGRVTKVIGPTDTAALPTVTYEYDLSTVPARTSVHARIASGQPAVLTTHTFTDGLGRVIQTRAPAEDSTKQVVTGAVEFNTRGQVVRQWVPYFDAVSSTYRSHTLVAGLAPPVSYAYDPMGRMLTITDPDGSISATRYDDWAVTSTDAKGSRTRRTADASGRLITVEEFNGTEVYATAYAYDALNTLTQVTDAQGHVTRITYDSLGRKLSMDDPDMGRWIYAYDAVDNLVAQTDARGVAIAFTYDALNRLTQKSYTIPTNSGIANPGTVTYTYDDVAKPFAKGKLTSITDGSGSSSFVYDTLGRLTSESKTIDGATSTISRAYDLLGRLTALTYPDTEVATYTYNPQGGLETVTLQSSTGSQSIVTNVDYNAAGQLTKIIYGNGTVSDYTYNPLTLRLDQLKTIGPSGTLQDFSYGFDAVGNVTAITDRVHTATQSFAYDPLHRLTEARGSYGTATYTYDAIGNMRSKEGRLFTYGQADGTKPHAVTATAALGAQAALQLTYDPNGNLLSKGSSSSPHDLITPSLYSYDAENRLVEVKTAPTETVAVTFQPGWNFFSLPVIPEDSSISALFPNFAQNFEQVIQLDPSQSATVLPSHFLHYVGNPKFNDFSSLEYGTGYQVYCKASSPVTVSFTGKLPTTQLAQPLAASWHLLPAISLQPAALSLIFSGVDYDQLKAYDTASSSLTTPTQVQPGQGYWVHVRTASTFRPSLPRDPTTRFVYDGDGGRVKQTTAAGTTTFLGEVVEKAPDGKTTKYVFAGSQRIAAKELSPGQQASVKSAKSQRAWARLWRRVLDFLDVPTAEAAALSSTIRFYHTDHLGSTNLITNSTGAAVEVAEYTPYGSFSRRDTPQPPQPLQVGEACSGGAYYTGQRLDATTGLYFYHARYYDPQLGRFTQPDSLVQAPSDPQSLNRYAYVRNNPITLVDPSGHGWFSKLMGAIAGVFVAVVTGCIQCGIAVYNFTDTLISARQAGVSWGRSLALASASAAISLITPGGILGSAAGGALQGVVGAAIVGGDIGHAAWTGAVSGVTTAAAGPIIGGGVGSVLNGGSFGRGAAEGAYGAAATVAIVAAGTQQVSNANSRTVAVAEAGQSGNPQIAADQSEATHQEISKTDSGQPNSPVGPPKAKAIAHPDRALYVDANATGAATGTLGPGGTIGFILGERGFFYYGVGLGIGAGGSATLSLGAPATGVSVGITGSGGVPIFGIPVGVKISGSLGVNGPSGRISFGLGVGAGVSVTAKQVIQIYGRQQQ